MISSRRMRRINESTSRSYQLIPTARARNLDSSLYETISFDYNLEITPKDRDFPMPWDADFEIVGKNFVLNGNAGPSGFGKSTTVLPVSSVSKYLEFEMYGDISQEDIDQLEDLGWIVK